MSERTFAIAFSGREIKCLIAAIHAKLQVGCEGGIGEATALLQIGAKIERAISAPPPGAPPPPPTVATPVAPQHADESPSASGTAARPIP